MIFNIQKFSVHDGPGIRTTVFFKGCPLRCRWCHNPESQAVGKELILFPGRCIVCGGCVDICTQEAIRMLEGEISIPVASGTSREREKALVLDSSTSASKREIITDRARCIACGDCAEVCYAEAREIAGREMSVAEVMAEIEKEIPFSEESGGGATFSGGEPLYQPEFLLSLLRACQEKEIHTALDTCGFASWEILDTIRKQVDLFLYDLKFIDETRHLEFTGVSNELILSNIRMLSERGHDIIIRLPVIPGINDDDENIRQIGEFTASLPRRKRAANSNRIDLLPYHHIAREKYQRLDRIYTLTEIRPPSVERMAEIIHLLVGFGLVVKTGG